MSKKIALTSTLILLLIFTGLSCGKKETTETPATTNTSETTSTTTTTDLTNATPTTIDTDFATDYALAQEKAKQWKGDAALVLVSVKLPQNLELSSSTLSFTYGSVSDPDYWWNISIAEKSGKYVRAIIPKADYLGTAATPVVTKYWKINYLEAFQIAEKNGGATFRTNNPTAEASLTLSHADPKGWLWWLVEYKTPAGSTLKVRINPNDKTVVDELGNVIATGTTSSTTSATDTSTSGTSTTGTATTTTGQ